MKMVLKRAGGAVGVGLIWGAAWAAVGALMRMLGDPNGFMNDVWLGPAIGLHPGFVGGVLFSVVLGVASRHRGLDELSLLRVAAWGSVTGLLLGLLPLAINEPPSESPLLLVVAVVIGSLTLLSAVSGVGSALLARMLKNGASANAW